MPIYVPITVHGHDAPTHHHHHHPHPSRSAHPHRPSRVRRLLTYLGVAAAGATASYVAREAWKKLEADRARHRYTPYTADDHWYDDRPSLATHSTQTTHRPVTSRGTQAPYRRLATSTTQTDVPVTTVPITAFPPLRPPQVAQPRTTHHHMIARPRSARLLPDGTGGPMDVDPVDGLQDIPIAGAQPFQPFQSFQPGPYREPPASAFSQTTATTATGSDMDTSHHGEAGVVTSSVSDLASELRGAAYLSDPDHEYNEHLIHNERRSDAPSPHSFRPSDPMSLSSRPPSSSSSSSSSSAPSMILGTDPSSGSDSAYDVWEDTAARAYLLNEGSRLDPLGGDPLIIGTRNHTNLTRVALDTLDRAETHPLPPAERRLWEGVAHLLSRAEPAPTAAAAGPSGPAYVPPAPALGVPASRIPRPIAYNRSAVRATRREQHARNREARDAQHRFRNSLGQWIERERAAHQRPPRPRR